jgi:hypothetical protein
MGSMTTRIQVPRCLALRLHPTGSQINGLRFCVRVPAILTCHLRPCILRTNHSHAGGQETR